MSPYSNSKRTTMPHSVSGVLRWNALAMKPNEPSVNIVPLNPKTDSWHADSKPSGNRQGRKTANGERFTASQVCGLRHYRNIPRYEPPAEPPTGKVVPIRVRILGVNTSTVHRWLNVHVVYDRARGTPTRLTISVCLVVPSAL